MKGTRHPFDIATDLEATGDGDWLARTSDAYWNMIGPFGGLIAALMFKSAYAHPDREGEPVALTVNFCAAIAKGEMRISAKPARTNRSTQHWTMTMLQAGECVATATAMFGKRPDTFAHRPAKPPAAAPFESLQRLPPPDAGWIERYDLRFAALTDIFFGRIIHVRKRMVPFGTVTLTSYFHATEADLAELASTPVLGTADARIFDRGFHDQSAELWSADGRLLATSHQLVYYRDPA